MKKTFIALAALYLIMAPKISPEEIIKRTYKVLSNDGKVYAEVNYEENHIYKKTRVYLKNSTINTLVTGLSNWLGFDFFTTMLEIGKDGKIKYFEGGREIKLEKENSDMFTIFDKIGYHTQKMDTGDKLETKVTLNGKLEEIIIKYLGKTDEIFFDNIHTVELKFKEPGKHFKGVEILKLFYHENNNATKKEIEIKIIGGIAVETNGNTYPITITDEKIETP